VVREADAKGLKQISADMRLLREKAVNGKLTPDEYQVKDTILYFLTYVSLGHRSCLVQNLFLH